MKDAKGGVGPMVAAHCGPPSDGIGVLGRPPAERYPQERDGGNYPSDGGRLPYFNRFVRLFEKQAIRTAAEGQPAPGRPRKHLWVQHLKAC